MTGISILPNKTKIPELFRESGDFAYLLVHFADEVVVSASQNFDQLLFGGDRLIGEDTAVGDAMRIIGSYRASY